MIRFTFFFILMVQIASVFLAVAFVYALIFSPESIGATVAQIILGFQNAMKGGA